MGNTILEQLTRPEQPNRLRLSSMGEQCPRSLWASVHSPSSREKFPPHARIKFHYGHVIEQMAIALAKAAGHRVEGEQDELVVDGVKGHRDCVIDGCIVDVKSINSLGFQKVKAGLVPQDIFLRSYLDQLDGYLVGSADDDLVTVKDKAYLWAIDKTLGHMCIYEHRIRPDHIRQRIAQYKQIVVRDEPPACECDKVPEGKSGNIKLGLKASYNPYKFFCFPDLRTFVGAKGPVYLTTVIRRPDMVELDRYGNTVL